MIDKRFKNLYEKINRKIRILDSIFLSAIVSLDLKWAIRTKYWNRMKLKMKRTLSIHKQVPYDMKKLI